MNSIKGLTNFQERLEGQLPVGYFATGRFTMVAVHGKTSIILCMHPANERRHNNVTLSIISWAHIQNYPRKKIATVLEMLTSTLIENIWLQHLLKASENGKNVYY